MERFLIRRDVSYRLEEIHETWIQSRIACGRLARDGKVAVEQHVKGSTRRWDEVRTYLRTHRDAYLVWVREEEHG
jgi:ribonuclease HI